MRFGNYIDTIINTTIIANELPRINNLLAKAQGSVSFWGERAITVDGYKSSFSLDKLAREVLRAGVQRSDSDDLTTEERVAGIEIRNKLENLYKVTDTKISQRNWFTRLCNWAREFTFFPYTPRFHTEDGLMENYFRGYSENKFVQEFGGVKNGMFNDYENSDGSFGSPLRIMAREDAIRSKLTAIPADALDTKVLGPLEPSIGRLVEGSPSISDAADPLVALESTNVLSLNNSDSTAIPAGALDMKVLGPLGPSIGGLLGVPPSISDAADPLVALESTNV